MHANLGGRQPTPLATQHAFLSSQLQEAKRLHLNNQLIEARVVYETILRAYPSNSDVKHLLGFLKHQQGEHKDAIVLLRQAVKVDRDNAVLQLNLANALKHVGEIGEALSAYKKALKLHPGYADAYVGYGGLLGDLGRFEDAVLQFDKALAINGKSIEALNNRGNALRNLKRLQPALESYDEALAINSMSEDAHYNRGIVLYDMGRFEAAVASQEAAVSIRPAFALAHSNRGNALKALGRHNEALASYDRALAVDPTCLEVRNNRGNALRDLNRPEEALACYDQILAQDPSFVIAHNNRGGLLKDLGRFEEARQAFEQALALDPTSGSHYENLAGVKKFMPGDPLIAAMEALLARSGRLSAADRTKLEYALGKAHSDCGNHTRAFEHYLRGAKAKRAAIDYDETATMRLFDRIESVFSADFIASMRGAGDPTTRPVFILGMPRSGTSLVEQILASHPQVFGAGELTAVNSAVNRIEAKLGSGTNGSFPELMRRLEAADFRRLGEDYSEQIRVLSPDRDRVTDKMPSNFFFLGLIHLAFPNAKIIHTLREPLDTCVSCFSILFSEPQHFSYDLAELGRYHRRYQQLMAHWHRVLPPGTFIDIRYEDVVADLETEARRIVAHCDLPWNEACLSFHEAKRLVRTASVVQVRQPIYSKAVGRWHLYEGYLDPLIAGLGTDRCPPPDTSQAAQA